MSTHSCQRATSIEKCWFLVHAGLVGGGNILKPGEISLAHRGVLFLDEIPEFGPRVLEVMRQPMEDEVITISRARGSLMFSANFQLIAVMNPCPCGRYAKALYLHCTNYTICSTNRVQVLRGGLRRSGDRMRMI